MMVGKCCLAPGKNVGGLTAGYLSPIIMLAVYCNRCNGMGGKAEQASFGMLCNRYNSPRDVRRNDNKSDRINPFD